MERTTLCRKEASYGEGSATWRKRTAEIGANDTTEIGANRLKLGETTPHKLGETTSVRRAGQYSLVARIEGCI